MQRTVNSTKESNRVPGVAVRSRRAGCGKRRIALAAVDEPEKPREQKPDTGTSSRHRLTAARTQPHFQAVCFGNIPCVPMFPSFSLFPRFPVFPFRRSTHLSEECGVLGTARLTGKRKQSDGEGLLIGESLRGKRTDCA